MTSSARISVQLCACVFLAACTDTNATVSEPVSAAVAPGFTFEKTDGPDKNPLKGWNASWDSDHPEASVGFQYVSWKALQPRADSFDFKAVDAIINKKGSRGRHVILRVYCQWAGDERTIADLSCPSWLFAPPYNVKFLVGTRGTSDTVKTLVDFNDPQYIAAAQRMIRALAGAYDRDPRVFAIQIGVLGYWGEWHTHRFRYNGQEVPISEAAATAIVSEYKSAFRRKFVVGRYPWRSPLSTVGGIGFHNDFFRANSGHSDEFDTAISAGAKWMQGPIGGETPPLDAADALTLYTSGSKAMTMIQTGHYSTMAPGRHRRAEGEPNRAEYMRLHRSMGYNFQLNDVRGGNIIRRGTLEWINVLGSNIGVAPFYYNWTVEIALLDTADKLVTSTRVPIGISRIMPGDNFTFAGRVPISATMPTGPYRLALRISQPDAATPKSAPWGLNAENVSVQFANRLRVVPPTWNSENALVGGWTVLRDVVVRP